MGNQVLYPHMRNFPYGHRRTQTGIPVCERAGIAKKFAYGDPRTHNEIVRIWGLTYTLLTSCQLCVTRRLFDGLLVPSPLRSQGKLVLANGSFLFPKQNRWNPRYGFFVRALLVLVNSICYKVVSPASLLISGITRSTTLTTRNTGLSRSAQHSFLQQSVHQIVNTVSIWILTSCSRLRQTTPVLISLLIRSSVLTMGIHHTFL